MLSQVKRFIGSILTHYQAHGLHACGKRCHIVPPAYFLGKRKISLGDNVTIGRCSRIEVYNIISSNNNPIIIIEDNVNINWYCHIGAINKIHICRNVLIGSYVLIIDHQHGDSEDLDSNPLSRPLISSGPIIIEENCWIGEKVSIMPNVRIGRNSIVGANSVVTKDVPPYSIVAGCPAKIIKNRYVR